MTQQHLTMGAGLTSPERAVPDAAPAASPAAAAPAGATARRTPHRRLLGAAAVASPALFTAFVAVDPAPLPREPAAGFLGAVADERGAFVLATTLQFGAMAAGVALAAYVALALAPRAPRLAPVVGVLLTLGYVGGASFAGAKMVAADLVVGGAPRTGAVEAWTAVQTGPLFDLLSWPLAMAIPGSLLLAVLLLRCRDLVGRWPALAVVAGFVLGSGEFSDPLTATGWVLQLAAVAHVVRSTLRDAR